MERLASAEGRPGLEQYADGFVAELGRLGYSPRTCGAQAALLRHLARWLAAGHVPLSGLSTHLGHVSPAHTYWYYSDSRVIPIPAPLRA